MKSDTKRIYQDFAEKSNVPMIIYIYETGKIVALNRRAFMISNKTSLTFRQLTGRLVRFSPEELNNGTVINYDIQFKNLSKKELYDCEFSIISMGENHIVVCMLVESYKQFFSKKMNIFIPRIYWNMIEDGKLSYKTYGNKAFHMEIDEYCVSVRCSDFSQELNNEDIKKFNEIGKRIINNKKGEFDDIRMVTLEHSNMFGKYQKIPIIDSDGKVRGILSMLNKLINTSQYEDILSNVLEGKSIVDNLINEGDTIYALWQLGENPKVRYISPNISKIGYNAREFYTGKITLSKLIYKDDYEEFLMDKDMFLEPEFLNTKMTSELRMIKKNGSLCWIHIDAISAKDENGIVVVNTIIHLIEKRKGVANKMGLLETSRRLKDSFTAMEQLFESVNSLIFVIYVSDYTILRVNNSVKNIYDKDKTDYYLGMDIFTFFEEKKISSYNFSNNISRKNIIPTDMPMAFCYDEINSRYYTYSAKRTKIYGEFDVIVITMSDVTEILSNKNDNDAQPYIDLLTKLPNRMGFENDIRKMFDRRYNNDDDDGAILIFDIDDFKLINEKYSYEVGDRLLSDIASKMSKNSNLLKHIYRLGGDEFIVVVDYESDTENIINEIMSMFNKKWKVGPDKIVITISMGVAKFTPATLVKNKTLKNAEFALSMAKNKGKNCVQYYVSAKNDRPIDSNRIGEYLVSAIAGGYAQFKVLYQPIIDAHTDKVIGAEALLRWLSPELGYINPMEFIPVSEYLGLIVPLGDYVCQSAFEMCKQINSESMRNFSVHINLSVVQLVQENFVGRVSEISRLCGVNNANVVFEVTESLSVDDIQFMKKMLEEIKKAGFEIALDDFGMGNSSINNIYEMPFDYIKIGHQFIDKIKQKEVSAQVLSGLAGLARSMKLGVIISGIETEEQMNMIKNYDADLYQGYYFGRPVDKESFINLFID